MVEMIRSDRKSATPPYVRDVRRAYSYTELPPGIGMRDEDFRLDHKRFMVSVVVMVITSLFLFFAPLFNGLFAGALGGYHAGRMKRALGAGAVTAVVVPLIIALAWFLAGPNDLRIFSGLGFWGWAVLNAIGTLVGAATGAASRPVTAEYFSEPRLLAPAGGPSYRSTTTTTQTVTRVERVETASPPSEPVREE